jgi:hypothetical protein
MKMSYGIILLLTMAAVLSTTALHCQAAEDANKEEVKSTELLPPPAGGIEEKDDIWSEDTAEGEHERFELTGERIERIMKRLAEIDPNKAEQLKQLQQKDPEKFKTELREVMREQRGKRIREHRKERQELLGHDNMPPGPGVLPEFGGRQSGLGRMPPEMGMQWRYDKYLEWLKENYAEEAKKLEDLSKKDPEVYWKHLGFSLKKYGKIAEAARENPRLAEVLKKDLALRQQQDKLLEEIETANDKDKEELIKGLKEVISSRFDVIVERKQIEYELLLERLERLKKDVEDRKAKMEKWKDANFKEDSVKARLEELLGKSDKFTW